MKKSILITMLLISLMLFITACSSPEKPEEPVDSDEIVEESVGDTNVIGQRLSAAYVDMMKSNNYMMKYRTFMNIDGIEMEALITIAVSDERSAFRTESDEINSATIMEDDKFHLIDHNSKTVMIMPFIIDDADDEGIDVTQVDSVGLEFVGTGTGTFMGNTRNYEEYVSESTTIFYYFDGDNLDGMEMIVEGETLIMDVEEMSSTIDESMFEIPEDYQVMEIGG